MQYILDQITDKIGEKLKRKVFQRGGGGKPVGPSMRFDLFCVVFDH